MVQKMIVLAVDDADDEVSSYGYFTRPKCAVATNDQLKPALLAVS